MKDMIYSHQLHCNSSRLL
uniref:Uncharacterized protein n=1 Tax=Rhizophora mucronata TaxID=61149 RepID=A0A2P2Q1X9_RHIMU